MRCPRLHKLRRSAIVLRAYCSGFLSRGAHRPGCRGIMAKPVKVRRCRATVTRSDRCGPGRMCRRGISRGARSPAPISCCDHLAKGGPDFAILPFTARPQSASPASRLRDGCELRSAGDRTARTSTASPLFAVVPSDRSTGFSSRCNYRPRRERGHGRRPGLDDARRALPLTKVNVRRNYLRKGS